jgi:hypothetical protein
MPLVPIVKSATGPDTTPSAADTTPPTAPTGLQATPKKG